MKIRNCHYINNTQYTYKSSLGFPSYFCFFQDTRLQKWWKQCEKYFECLLEDFAQSPNISRIEIS